MIRLSGVCVWRSVDSFTILNGLNIILKFCMGRLETASLWWLVEWESSAMVSVRFDGQWNAEYIRVTGVCLGRVSVVRNCGMSPHTLSLSTVLSRNPHR